MSATKERPPRVAGFNWQIARPLAIAVYNANYAPSGRKIGDFPKPWTAMGPECFERFPTHAEAVAYAFKEAGK